MALLSMHQYLSAKHMRRKERLYQNALIPIDNVLHSLWSRCNIMMNGELVSMTNQKYMYKSYFETILTLDKNVYQRWQLWSHKAKLALEAMEGDTEKTKISYLHHWLNGEGISKTEGWKNSKTLISQAEYDALESKTGKYSLDKIESYFTLCELALTPRSNPFLAVEYLYLAKQGSMTSGEFHSHILKIVKRCQFPCQQAEERAVRDAIFMGMNSQRARDKAINLMNEEGKEVTVEFLMNHLAVEDGNTQHKFLSQINSNSSVNFAAYDRRQNREEQQTKTAKWKKWGTE